MSRKRIEGSERRGMPRWASGEDATVEFNGAQHPCVVGDISASGVRFQCDATLSVGDEVSLHLKGVQPLQLRIIRVGTDLVAAVFVDGLQYLFR